jgi:transposase
MDHVHGPYLCNVFESLGWPAYSPDFSPIEHMWAIVKKKLKGGRLADEDELFKAVSEAWTSIEMTTINNLVNSFPATCRLQAARFASR